MLWQYRTNLFEFTKDGLLGDKYVDDEEMEKTLNELGRQEWEMVSVSLLQDGLLVFLKRPAQEDAEFAVEQSRVAETIPPPVTEPRPAVFSRESITASQIQPEEREDIRDFDLQRKNSRRSKEAIDFVGDIKIS
jgi:hypothetical protein